MRNIPLIVKDRCVSHSPRCAGRYYSSRHPGAGDVSLEAPAGRRAFNLSADFARQTRVLAANQGLYNGFLAAGLAWGLWLGAPGVQVVIFFLACVLAAGIFGALTASRKILYIQALPALLALVAVLTQA